MLKVVQYLSDNLFILCYAKLFPFASVLILINKLAVRQISKVHIRGRLQNMLSLRTVRQNALVPVVIDGFELKQRAIPEDSVKSATKVKAKILIRNLCLV